MAHRLLRDVEADGWERSDFPIICESCLGDNPYVRMTKAQYDKECKICTRPFTVFRWRPGRDARYKKTEICQTCSKLKNVCQVCLLDLEYGLPVQVRDSALGVQRDAIPQSDVNKEYFAEQHDRDAKAGLDFDSSYGKVRPNDTILKLQRTTPYYKRNRAHICSFFVKGECTRGAECPFRHEMPVQGELSQQNIKDRYYGVNDPVARKLLAKASEMPSLLPPDDETITTLYVGGVPPENGITEVDLREVFENHGDVKSVRVIPTRGCAFVTYTTREAAERAATELVNKLVIKNHRLKLMWGRPQQPRGDGPPLRTGPGADTNISGGPPPHLVPRVVQQPPPPGAPPQPPQQAVDYFNLPPPAPMGGDRPYYPSMDPHLMGARPVRNKEEGGEKKDGGGEQAEGAKQPQQWQPQPQQFQYPPPGPYGAPPGQFPPYPPPPHMYPPGSLRPPPPPPTGPPLPGYQGQFYGAPRPGGNFPQQGPPGVEGGQGQQFQQGPMGVPRGPPPPHPQPAQ